MVKPPEKTRDFQSLVEVVQALRGPHGCPWDKEQTHHSLTAYAIEEAHELAEAIEFGSTADLVEELGDLLLQVVLHAEIARQAQSFELADVVQSITEKMIRRHPHVFANSNLNTGLNTSEEVLAHWAQIKEKEKASKQNSAPPTAPWQIPLALPALQRAAKIGRKTKDRKFDWPDIKGVTDKVAEEWSELQDALLSNDIEAQKAEIGDMLFSLAQLARHLGAEPEQILRETNQRFEKRFVQMLKITAERGLNWDELSDPQKEQLWQASKKSLTKK